MLLDVRFLFLALFLSLKWFYNVLARCCPGVCLQSVRINLLILDKVSVVQEKYSDSKFTGFYLVTRKLAIIDNQKIIIMLPSLSFLVGFSLSLGHWARMCDWEFCCVYACVNKYSTHTRGCLHIHFGQKCICKATTPWYGLLRTGFIYREKLQGNSYSDFEALRHWT